jgi:hypothetical protein
MGRGRLIGREQPPDRDLPVHQDTTQRWDFSIGHKLGSLHGFNVGTLAYGDDGDEPFDDSRGTGQ